MGFSCGGEDLKTWYAIAIYVVAVCFLLACTGIIVYKLLFIVPCTPTGPQASLCVADGWSIAGLAATVLGVAAAMLTILGAFAVAYWWAELDKRVSEQVKGLYEKQKGEVNSRVGELLSDQKTKVDKLLSQQQENIEDQKRQIDQSNRELRQIHEQIDSIIDLTFSLADVNPPWELEEWAKEVTDRFNTVEAAKGMVLSYLKIVDRFIAQSDTHRLSLLEELHKQHAPSAIIQHYWVKAQEWAERVEQYYKLNKNISFEGDMAVAPDGKTTTFVVTPPLRIVREKITEYEPKIMDYAKHRPLYPDKWMLVDEDKK